MTFAQYAAKFEELSRYAPALIAEENIRVRKFENRLRDRILQLVTVFELPTYKEVVNKCLIIEKGLNDAQVAREKSLKKRNRAIDFQGQSSRAFKPKIPKPSQTAVESKTQYQGSIICYRCGGPHLKRDCTWPGGQCYKCGRDGHKAVVCRNGGESQRQQMPQNYRNTPANRAPQDVQRQDAGQQKSKTQGRVYALTQQDANASNSMVTGMIKIASNNIYALFDPGATHSFIATSFIKKTNEMSPTPLENNLCVCTPSGEVILVNSICKDCVLNQSEFSFKSTRPFFHQKFLSAIHAQKFLRKGCEGFLATVLDTQNEKLKLEDIPIVKEFPDIFSNDLPGLPPDREIEFTIDLIPGTSLVSKASYRMAPAELKELQKQLQELLDKGFIRPSVSPWGAPVLFVKKKDGSLRLCIDYRELNK
uniref:Uncharacterized protein LOC105037801 n=1 Tax=Elaeis guineensis var. tenera TaxID=51953 RepID=A0A6I9QQD8_ELAGV